MAAGPYLNLLEAVIYNAIACIQPILAGLKDEHDQPISVPMRSVYTDLESEFSEVVLEFHPGAIQFMGGMNLQLYDPINNVYTYGVHAPESTILLGVKARKDAERWFLVDALLSGIMASFSVDASGNPYENEVLHNLGLCGIIVTGFGALDAPSPDLGDVRPEGQVYEATLPVQCDVWMQWSRNPVQATGVQIQPVVTSDAGVPPYMSVNDPLITV